MGRNNSQRAFERNMAGNSQFDISACRQRVKSRQAITKQRKSLVNSNQAQMCSDDRSCYNAYKKLITDIAEALQQDDCERLSYQQDISGSLSGLELLKKLENNGTIGKEKITQLADMLEGINRSDLINSKIEPFERKFPSSRTRHSSLPGGTTNQYTHLTVERRAKTFSDFGSTEMLEEVGLRDVPQQETSTDSESEASAQTLLKESETAENPCTESRATILASTPLLIPKKYSLGTSNSASSMKVRSRHPSDIMKTVNASSISQFAGRSNSGSASSSMLELMHLHSNPQSNSTSCDHSRQASTSDLSSTAGEMWYYHKNAQQRATMNTRVSEELSSTRSSPISSSDYRLGSTGNRITRSNSVLSSQSEYVLINKELCEVLSFEVSPTESGPPFRRSFTSPASIPLARGPSLGEPKCVVSPLSEHTSYIPRPGPVTHTIENRSESSGSTLTVQDQPKQLPIAQVRSSTSEDITEQALLTQTQQVAMNIQSREPSAFHPIDLSSRSKESSGTPSSSSSPLLQCPTPSSKASGEYVTTKEHTESADVGTEGIVEPQVKQQLRSVTKKSTLRRLSFRSKSGQKELSWSVKRNKLNKAIYEHKENKTIECTKKLELDVGHKSSLNPKLSLILHPYGLESDKRRYVTLEVRIDVSKKAPKLSSGAKVRFSVSATDVGENKQLFKCTVEKDALLREFFINKFISHEALRDSRSETIEIKAYV